MKHKALLGYGLLFGVAALVSVPIHARWGMTGVHMAALTYVAAAATCFTLTYHITAQWWKTVIGRNIMLLIGSIAAVLVAGLTFNLLERPEWMRYVFAGLYFAIGTAIWRRIGILIDAQYPDQGGHGHG